MSRMNEVIHPGKDRDDDHSDTPQQNAQRATLESDRPTTPEEPLSTFPERKFGDLSLSHVHPLVPRDQKRSAQREARLKVQPRVDAPACMTRGRGGS